MTNRAGAELTGQSAGLIWAQADGSKADGWSTRTIPNAKIHLEKVFMPTFIHLGSFPNAHPSKNAAHDSILM
jgi:hypothetical protein